MNILISGQSGAGKTTAIGRILQELNEPIYGFRTKKYVSNLDGYAPVYLHACREPLCFCENNLIGLCKDRGAQAFPNVFDALGVAALSDIPEGSLVLMDELGFLENDAQLFQKRVLEILDGNFRVIAAIKKRRTSFLDAVRMHPKSICKEAVAANTPEFLAYATQILR